MTQRIVRWDTDEIIWEGEADTVKDALIAAIVARRSLYRADFTDADFRGANLTDADFRGADFTDADFRGANLTDADFRGANFTGANFRGANFTGANLRGANFTAANFTAADFTGANFRGANLTDADFRGANLTDADFRGAKGVRAPIIAHIDATILAAIRSEGCALNMGNWHTCETTHCRAGWAIHLAGDAGYALEDRIGSAAAGALIYAASRPGKPVPDFYATTDAAMTDLEVCADADPLPSAQ